jgi:hypothetical protein
MEDSVEDSVEAGPVGGRRYAIQCTALKKGCNSICTGRKVAIPLTTSASSCAGASNFGGVKK